jgi:hypothetical protein
MNDIVIAPEGFREYGQRCAAMASSVSTAGAVDQAATVAAAAPVFGLIGADFLAAFAGAQHNHLTSVAELSAVHAASAAAAHRAADAYEATERASAAGFGAVDAGR